MATRARYTLIEARRETGAYDGRRFFTVRRTAWKYEFRVSTLEPTSITVVIEASATGNADDEFDVIHTAVLSVADQTTELLVGATRSGRDENARDTIMRARITTLVGSGDYTLEVLASSRLFDPEEDAPDLLLLSRTIQDFDDTESGEGRIRLVERAEADVLAFLRQRQDGDIPTVDLGSELAPDLLKEAIALQTAHVFQVDRIRDSRDAGAIPLVRDVGRYANGLEEILSPVLWGGTMPVMRHR